MGVPVDLAKEAPARVEPLKFAPSIYACSKLASLRWAPVKIALPRSVFLKLDLSSSAHTKIAPWRFASSKFAWASFVEVILVLIRRILIDVLI